MQSSTAELPLDSSPSKNNIIVLRAVIIGDGKWFLEAVDPEFSWSNLKDFQTARRFTLTEAFAFAKSYRKQFGSEAMTVDIQPVGS